MGICYLSESVVVLVFFLRDWRMSFADLRRSVVFPYSNMCLVSQKVFFLNAIRQIQICKTQTLFFVFRMFSSLESGLRIGIDLSLRENDRVCVGCEISLTCCRCSLSISRLLTCQTVQTGICCY